MQVISKDGKRFETDPKNVFLEKYLYGFEVNDEMDVTFEEALSATESETFPAILRIHESHAIREDDINLILNYLACAYLRNPVLRDGAYRTLDSGLRAFIQVAEQNGELPPVPEDIEAFGGKYLSQLIEENIIELNINNGFYLESFVRMLDNILNLLRRFTIGVVVDENERFMLGDFPTPFLHPSLEPSVYGIPFGAGDCELTFPVSPSVSLVLGWDGVPPCGAASDKLIEQLNRRQIMFARKHIVIKNGRGVAKKLANRYRQISLKMTMDDLPTPDGILNLGRKGLHPIPAARAVWNDIQAICN